MAKWKIMWLKFSVRPNGQKRGSAEPERFGNFHRRFGRTLAIFGLLPQLNFYYFVLGTLFKIELKSKYQLVTSMQNDKLLQIDQKIRIYVKMSYF